MFYHGNFVFGLWDAFPVTPGHALLIPTRHVTTWFDATEAERQELTAAVGQACTAIQHEHRPDGYNIGVNIGEAAGQRAGRQGASRMGAASAQHLVGEER